MKNVVRFQFCFHFLLTISSTPFKLSVFFGKKLISLTFAVVAMVYNSPQLTKKEKTEERERKEERREDKQKEKKRKRRKI